MISSNHQAAFESEVVTKLRDDLAVALRAASKHGLAEGVCNHFSIELPDDSGRFLLNPRGLLWQEVQAEDIVLIDIEGNVLAGKHEVEPTAMYIHSAVHRVCQKVCVLHTHMPHATALSLTKEGALDPTLSQTAMRFYGRVAVDLNYNGLALDISEGERIARSMQGSDIVFLGNHGVIVCNDRMDHAYDDLYYLERSCELEVLALSTGKGLVPVSQDIVKKVCDEIEGERLQSELHFAALRRTV